MVDITSLRARLERGKGQRAAFQASLAEAKADLKEIKAHLIDIKEGRAIIQRVAQDTQRQVEFHMSHLVTKALNAVYTKPYEFRIEFVERRGKTECDMFLIEDDEKLDPLTMTGGGVCDIIAFVLRLAIWSIDKSRPTLICDEPFKFLHSEELQTRCSEMVKTISEQLGLQIIIVSDQPKLIANADKVITLEKGEVKENET